MGLASMAPECIVGSDVRGPGVTGCDDRALPAGVSEDNSCHRRATLHAPVAVLHFSTQREVHCCRGKASVSCLEALGWPGQSVS